MRGSILPRLSGNKIRDGGRMWYKDWVASRFGFSMWIDVDVWGVGISLDLWATCIEVNLLCFNMNFDWDRFKYDYNWPE